MKKIRTCDLLGAVLDWVVEHLEFARMEAAGEHIKPWVKENHDKCLSTPARYSTDWLAGGEIIEREGIHIATLASGIDPFVHQTFKQGDQWEAEKMRADEDSIVFTAPTPLIAAMRCYVADKLGGEVDVPEELV